MRKARLLFTEDCNRRCKGCCNRNWKGEPAVEKTIEELREYDEIYITGGEPMLYVDALNYLIGRLRTATNKIFLYTAMPYPQHEFIPLMIGLDGCTVTLHNYADRQKFIDNFYNRTMFAGKSMRLNVFPKGKFDVDDSWDVRPKVWITDAPLPEGEEFVKLSDYKIGRNG
jgi:organic radical activating enzyme